MFKRANIFVLLFAVTAIHCKPTLIGQTLSKKLYTNDERLNYNGARDACRAMDGTLAMVNDPETLTFILTYFPKHGYFHWIGAQKPSGQVFFKWQDGSPVDWAEFLREYDQLDCLGAYIEGRSSVWTQAGCEEDYQSICEVRLDSGKNSSETVDGRVPNESDIEFFKEESLKIDNVQNKTTNILATMVLSHLRFDKLEAKVARLERTVSSNLASMGSLASKIDCLSRAIDATKGDIL